jgi:hypothetical protein
MFKKETVYDKAMKNIGTAWYVVRYGTAYKGKIIDFRLSSKDKIESYTLKIAKNYTLCVKPCDLYSNKEAALSEQAKQLSNIDLRNCKTCKNFEEMPEDFKHIMDENEEDCNNYEHVREE